MRRRARRPPARCDIEEAGQKLKRVRERLNMRFRDVEEASLRVAERRKSDEFAIPISRLSDIENKGVVPPIFRLYTLSAIYRLDFAELLQWYGVDLAQLPADVAALPIERTHLVGFPTPEHGSAVFPLALDPGIDTSKTTYLSRLIQRWGTLPLMLLTGLDPKNHRYAFVGTEDWTMYPILQPGALVQIDETRRRVVNHGWSNEFERPIYFLEHRDGYICSWCAVVDDKLMVVPHPASEVAPRLFALDGVDVIGQVSGIATRWDLGVRRRTHS
ncbi:MAG: helix-turn-helix transcriptional regulator [Bryobacterales bacterium]|nr:helix-turn-helix transcriptional regulator [Bryobacterales bacterium]